MPKPVKKKPYRKPVLRKSSEPHKMPRSSLMRIFRVDGLEATLAQYFTLARRLELERDLQKSNQQKVKSLGETAARMKAGIEASINEIGENYTLSKSQQSIIAQIRKSLESPTKENKERAMRLTCGLKFED